MTNFKLLISNVFIFLVASQANSIFSLKWQCISRCHHSQGYRHVSMSFHKALQSKSLKLWTHFLSISYPVHLVLCGFVVIVIIHLFRTFPPPLHEQFHLPTALSYISKSTFEYQTGKQNLWILSTGKCIYDIQQFPGTPSGTLSTHILSVRAPHSTRCTFINLTSVC